MKQQAINTVRLLAVDMVQKANSGHPGLPLGCAPMAFTLWNDVMKFNPHHSDWINRDRFILSAGHGSAMLYALLHLFDAGLTLEDLKQFRQLDSKTPGHPEYGHTLGVDATTGPLGQGMTMAVGMAMAEENLAQKFNRENYPIIDHYTYAIVGDGCLQEGITNEAASLAGSLGLKKLIVLYDSNHITIDGRTDDVFNEDVCRRFEALGWDTFNIADGNNVEEIAATIEKAKQSEKPSLIKIETKIGYGSIYEGSEKSHGAPIGKENIPALRKNLNWEYDTDFYVPENVKSYMKERILFKEQDEIKWDSLLQAYQKDYPNLYEELQQQLDGNIPEVFLDDDAFYRFEKDDASRNYSHQVLNRLKDVMPNLIGGSADLAGSNKTHMKGVEKFTKNCKIGRNLQFGVREHAMGAISNGIALHGGFIPYCATFFVFSDYLKPAMRLSSLMQKQVLYIFTHDSIGVGEDGPTHEPIEQLAMLRSIPNMTTFRPADGMETACAYRYALDHKTGPTAIVLSRQTLPNLSVSSKEAMKGAYVLKDFGETIELILIATGSEVELAMQVAEKLEGIGTRVVSMPSMELFERQDEKYKEQVLPKAIRKRVSIECLSTFGWDRYVGFEGITIGLDSFGASAPQSDLMKKYGFTVEQIIEKIKPILE